MRIPMFLLFIFPLLEIFLIIQVGDEIGALATIAWLVAAVFLGVNILRYQGVSAMRQTLLKMQADPLGARPGQAILDSVVKAMGAVLLIIPGFATDILALICFIPVLRRLLFNRWVLGLVMDKRVFSAHNPQQTGFRGRIYEHQGDSRSSREREVSGQVLEHEPDKKD